VSLGWACLALAGTTQALAEADDVAAVLGRMRQAASGVVPAGRSSEFLIEGKADRAGSTAVYSVRFNPAGMFLQTTAGPLSGKVGFNGRECWSVDWGGMPARLALHDLDRNRLWLGMQTGQWLARADPATVAVAETEGGRDEVVLDIIQGRLKAKLHVDRGTWLPTSLVTSGVKGPETWAFADYLGIAGLKVPGTVTVTRTGRTDTYRVASIRPAPEAPAGVYDPVTARPDDTQFDPSAPPDVQVKRARTGHVLVRPGVDGLDLGWFIFDTGAAGSVLDPTASAKLRHEPVGTSTVTSFLGTVRTSILRADSLALGPMTVAKPFFMTMDLGFVRGAMGEDVVGVVGYDVLSRSVAEITLADDSIKLYDPRAHRLEAAPWQPLTFNQSLPVVSAAFEGDRKGLFRIDVGASGPGPTEVALGKIAWFELAGHRFENPDVVFALDRQGPLGDEYVEGNIGVEFLRPFRMVLDYAKARVAFLPRVKGR
jgi:hypothetical protein